MYLVKGEYSTNPSPFAEQKIRVVTTFDEYIVTMSQKKNFDHDTDVMSTPLKASTSKRLVINRLSDNKKQKITIDEYIPGSVVVQPIWK